MRNLAINGGKPIRKTPLYYGHQWIDEDDINAVISVLRSDHLTCGPAVDKLEQKLCEITGAKFAVALSNGTAAGVGEGDEVITAPMTFAVSANCVLYRRANKYLLKLI